MSDLNDLLKVMFDSTETVCSSKDVRATNSKRQSEVSVEDAFLTINPISGRRRIADVTAFRTFLIEIDPDNWGRITVDEMEHLLQDQYEYLERSGLPFSAAVYSGNKSIHFLVVLDEPFANYDEYKFHFRWIANTLPKIDSQAGSAIVGVRVPGHQRFETKKMQVLEELRGRVSRKELMGFLEKFPEARPQKKMKESYSQVSNNAPVPLGSRGRLSERTQLFLAQGAPRGYWHMEFRLAVKDFKAQRYSIEEAERSFHQIEGYLDYTSKQQLKYGYENSDWEMSFRPMAGVNEEGEKNEE